MSDVVLDRKQYAEVVGESEELLDPLPQCAPSNSGVALLPFVLALPSGSGRFTATFLFDIFADVTEALVRYGSFPPMRLPLVRSAWLAPGDSLTITLSLRNG